MGPRGGGRLWLSALESGIQPVAEEPPIAKYD